MQSIKHILTLLLFILSTLVSPAITVLASVTLIEPSLFYFSSASTTEPTLKKINFLSTPKKNEPFFLEETPIKLKVRSKNCVLGNHLANVKVVISDEKVVNDLNASNTVDNSDNFEPLVLNYTDAYPFGQQLPSRKYSANGEYRYGLVNGQENDIEINANVSTAEFWQYDSRNARRWNIDPITKDWESPYAAFANNPIWFSDPNGADSTQRANAVKKAQDYVDKKASGNQYEMKAKGNPGEKVDCSGLASKCVMAGEEKNPNFGDGGSGVVNIQNNTTKIDVDDIQVGNIVTFKFSSGYPYHIGMVVDVTYDASDKVKSVTFIHSEGGTGPKKSTFNVDDEKGYGANVYGYYKWDSKPDGEKPALKKADQDEISLKMAALSEYKTKLAAYVEKAKTQSGQAVKFYNKAAHWYKSANALSSDPDFAPKTEEFYKKARWFMKQGNLESKKMNQTISEMKGLKIK